MVTAPAVRDAAVPEIFVPTNVDGVPRFGVVKTGLVANTAAPLPVSSVRAPERFAEENEPREVALPEEVTTPVRLAFVVTVAAFPPIESPDAVPVKFVATPDEGVPRAPPE